MKKLVLSICALALVASTMTSCKKVYTCECTFSGLITGTASGPTEKLSKKDAKAACEKENGTVNGQTISCSIK